MNRHRSPSFLLSIISIICLAGPLWACGEEPEAPPPVAVDLTGALVRLGLPLDYAEFFAAAEISVRCRDESNCTIVWTYPNGAAREIVLTATPDPIYTPTAAELEYLADVEEPVYDARFTAIDIEEDATSDTARVEFGFFVPSASLPTRGRALRVAQASGPFSGFQLDWKESGKKGADVAIGSLLDHYKDLGKAVESTGSIYAAASALSDIAEAMKISREVTAWLAELAELEACASDPTNPLTQSDPTYSANTVASIRRARAELKELSAVRFINAIDDTAMGLTPVSTVLSIGLKQATVWTEQTLQNLSQQLMKDARSSVVSCRPSCPSSFAASGISESAIRLTWVDTAIGDTVTTFTLDGGNTAGASTTDTDYLDGGLEKSTEYCYTITASNDYGAAESCPQACGTTLGPPRVERTDPVSDETGISVNAQVSATFSEAVDPGTVVASAFFVSGPSGSVAATLATSGKIVTLAPSGALAYDTRYTATLTTGIEDLDGSPMEASYTWSFTTEAAPAAGNLRFEIDLGEIRSSGSATVMWTKFEDLGDVRRYVPSGTFTADIFVNRCDPILARTFPIEASVPFGPGYALVVYTETNAAFPRSYLFGLAGDPGTIFNFTCYEESGEPFTLSLPASMINIPVGGCPSGGRLVPFTDEGELAGTYSCPELGLVSAAWDFSP